MEKNSEIVVEKTMRDLGIISGPQPVPAFQGNPAVYDPTNSTFYDPLVSSSRNLVNSSRNLVNSSSNLVNTTTSSYNKNLTKNQQPQLPVNSSQNLVNSSQYSSQNLDASSQVTSEQAKQAKADLEVLVATGKTKDFLGRHFTFQDLDYMSEKDLLKYHRIYQSTLAVRVNDTFSKIAVKSYAKLVSLMLPIKDENKLYDDLRNDYILMNELDRWTGWLSLRMGGLMAVATTSLITVSNCGPSSSVLNDYSRKINDGEPRSGEPVGEPGSVSFAEPRSVGFTESGSAGETTTGENSGGNITSAKH